MTFLPKKKKNPLVQRRKLAVLCVLVGLIGIGSIIWGLSALKPHPDQLLFSSNQRLYLVNTDGSQLEEVPIPELRIGEKATWSPDGNSITFSAYTDGQIYSFNLQNNNLRQLTSNPEETYIDPVWSPNGRYIGFVRIRQAGVKLYIFDLDNSQIFPIPDLALSPYDYSPSWSSDGSQIIYSAAADDDEYARIYLTDMDTRETRAMTSGYAEMPAWSPDNQQIAFVSDDEYGTNDVYLMDMRGQSPLNIANGKGWDWKPAWSPDGSYLAYIDNLQKIIVVSLETLSKTELSPYLANVQSLAWSPDSQSIAFVSYADGDNDIYVMRADGSDVRQLTFNKWDDRNPQWRPR
jgi:TolB protein